eukprot:gnl/TRDRNA2_/TRDRNA2_170916_c0_seq1.p1 gnl/TRDRNA2_/TRDRNA2_170916_c0~~gnl/TRDRNA2_/TRDRNA2_170916_c0_seq1.p1  ORF type:complete len:181 (-),score=55.90 gnl/TRDRNA2_/TRDRNA2_170916_c0_seq1:212-754(-)
MADGDGMFDEDRAADAEEEEEPLNIPYECADKFGFRDSEIRDFAWSFKVSDILGDGIITTKEVRRVLTRLGEAPTDQEFLKSINDVDPHARGVLDFQKFVKLMSYFDRDLVTEQELGEAFQMFDRDKSGTIDAIELQTVLKSLGFKITDLEAEKMIKEADEDGGGDVTFDEFCKKIIQNQ